MKIINYFPKQNKRIFMRHVELLINNQLKVFNREKGIVFNTAIYVETV